MVEDYRTDSSSSSSVSQSTCRPPNTLPLVGNGILFLQARQKLFHWFTKCERQFGFETFEISVPSLPPGVVINDPKNLDYVLKHDDLFNKGDFFRRRSWDLFGNGIINADGQLWKVQRKAGLRFFSNSNLKVLIDVFLPRFMSEAVTQLREHARQEEIVDLESVFLDLTTRIMGRAAYDMEMRASEPFSEAFEFASGAIGERFQNPLWSVTEIIFGKRLRRAIAEVKTFGQVVVKMAMAKRRAGSDSEKDLQPDASAQLDTGGKGDFIRGSLINSLIDEIPDSNVVSDAALNFLSAGRDTTAQALTWTFFLLMRNPDVVRQLRHEQDEVVAERQDSRLCYESIQPTSMPLALAVFYESLRLYPPVPFEIKQAARETILPDGTFLPIGAVVVWCPWAMGRSTLIWGEDAGTFRPDRWLDRSNGHDSLGKKSKPTLRSRTQSEFPVFNGGPRTCLGKKMAELQAVYVMATLIRDFDFEEVKATSGAEERQSRNSLTLPMEGGLPCLISVASYDRPASSSPSMLS